MRQNAFAIRTFAALLGAAATLYAGNALAGGDFDQASSYSVGFGMQPGEENAPISGSTRDENGNKVFVNGVAQGSAYAVTDNVHQSGVGFPGSGGNASATAIGNALNVTVNGSWNTVIVDSKQVNNGNQSASLNGDIHF
jgi:holdfast attachment protein HfaA